jgi:hypothetical protein
MHQETLHTAASGKPGSVPEFGPGHLFPRGYHKSMENGYFGFQWKWG